MLPVLAALHFFADDYLDNIQSDSEGSNHTDDKIKAEMVKTSFYLGIQIGALALSIIVINMCYYLSITLVFAYSFTIAIYIGFHDKYIMFLNDYMFSSIFIISMLSFAAY